MRVVGGGVIDGNGSAHWYKTGPDSTGDWTNMEVHTWTCTVFTQLHHGCFARLAHHYHLKLF